MTLTPPQPGYSIKPQSAQEARVAAESRGLTEAEDMLEETSLKDRILAAKELLLKTIKSESAQIELRRLGTSNNAIPIVTSATRESIDAATERITRGLQRNESNTLDITQIAGMIGQDIYLVFF